MTVGWWRQPTQQEMDEHASAAIERISAKYPWLRSPAGGLQDDPFVDDAIAAMVSWLADTSVGK